MNSAEWHGKRGVRSVANQPFELGADGSWWTGFEAYCPDQPFGVGLRYRWLVLAVGIRVCAGHVGVRRVGGQRSHHLLGESRQFRATETGNCRSGMVIP